MHYETFLSHVYFVVNILYDIEVSDRTYQISVLTADMGLPETNIINRFYYTSSV